MKKSEKIWSLITSANFLIVVWFALVTNYCQKSMREAQNSEPPPPPDDYIGALFYSLLNLTTVFFGILFIVSLIILTILFVKNKYSAKSTDQKIEVKPDN